MHNSRDLLIYTYVTCTITILFHICIIGICQQSYSQRCIALLLYKVDLATLLSSACVLHDSRETSEAGLTSCCLHFELNMLHADILISLNLLHTSSHIKTR